jgi:kynurenine formamidase
MENQKKQILVDLSQPLTDRMPVYPGDEPPRLEKINSMAQDGFNNFRFTGGMHIGTHIDGPMHMTHFTHFMDDLPLKQFIGKGCLLNALGMKIISLTPEFSRTIVPKSIVLVYTGYEKFFGTIRLSVWN